MTVEFRGKVMGRVFTANDVLWCEKNIVQDMVANALINQTEAHLHMFIDCEDEELTRSALTMSLKGVKANTKELLVDMLDDMRRQVFETLEHAVYTANVTAIKWDDDGRATDIDATVSVSHPTN